MKITIFTVGSRGDVEPYVALAQGLMASGHQITFATEARFESFVKSRGLNFAMIPGDTHQALNTEAAQKALNRKNNTRAFFELLSNASLPFANQILENSVAACREADHIIAAPFCLYISYLIAQQLSKPLSVAAISPFLLSDTRYFHNLFFPAAASWLPGAFQRRYNLFTHRIMPFFMWKTFTGFYGESWKRYFGTSLPAIDPVAKGIQKDPCMVIYGYSPALLSKPVDWGSNQHVTGYWFLKQESEWVAPSAHEDFIYNGEPPVYIGFGSMNNSLLKTGQLEKLIVEIVNKTGLRAVVLKQGLNLDGMDLPANIFATDPVPFAWLFPKMRLLVHHGGAGTTGLGLVSGVPSVITPLIVDQKFWAYQVAKAGVGSKPINWHMLSGEKLSKAILTTISDQAMQLQTGKLGKVISVENGVETAVSVFNRTFAG